MAMATRFSHTFLAGKRQTTTGDSNAARERSCRGKGNNNKKAIKYSEGILREGNSERVREAGTAGR